MPRLMGLDIGEKRIGVAISDDLGITAQPIGVVEHRSESQVIKELRALVSQHGITGLVVGLPRNMNGTCGPKAEEVRRLAEILAREFTLPVAYQDERLSTRAVEAALLEADVSRSKRRKVIDKLAAVYILQGYLDRQAQPDGERID